jgi:hypothetical protein
VGIESFDAAIGGDEPSKREHKALTTLIEVDEVLIRRFRAFEVVDQGALVFEIGVGVFVSNRRVVALQDLGLIRSKMKTWTCLLSGLAENVVRTESLNIAGKPQYNCGFWRERDDQACMVVFREERDRDAFAAVLQAALDASNNGHVFSESDLDAARELFR